MYRSDFRTLIYTYTYMDLRLHAGTQWLWSIICIFDSHLFLPSSPSVHDRRRLAQDVMGMRC